MQVTRPAVLGFLAGFALGMADYLLLRAFDVEMSIGQTDVTIWVVLLFAATFGALGAVIARLWEHRRSLEHQASLIRAQYAELRDVQDQLVEHETLAAIGQMSAGIAHEVRNPLSVIRSSAQMLGDDLDEADVEVVEFIRDEVDRLDDFVSRVLEFSRHVDVATAPTPWATLRDRLRQTVPATVDIANDGGTYDVDVELTVRVLSNLVDNALKVADDVAVIVRPRDGTIEVVDDGPGVSESDMEKVFEPFFTTRAQGTGLGLAMARKLARVQGWDLSVHSATTGGACFRFAPSPGWRES